MARVCVVLPCTPNDFRWLPLALASIARQTLKPALVSVQLSGFRSCDPMPPVDGLGLNMSVACSRKRLSCGGGRNAAVRRCGDVDFYKYFDADDEMMPYQLQRMATLMRKHNASVGYHGYFPKDSGPVVRDDSQLRARIHSDGGRWRKFSPFHELQTQHGQAMVRASAWWPLDERNTLSEDIRFARQAWERAGIKFVHTTEKLTRYMRRKP